MKRWYWVAKGSGYQGLPWWPKIAGALGYYPDGSSVACVDLVFFRRLYLRLWELQMPPFGIALEQFRRVTAEMNASGASPLQDRTPQADNDRVLH